MTLPKDERAPVTLGGLAALSLLSVWPTLLTAQPAATTLPAAPPGVTAISGRIVAASGGSGIARLRVLDNSQVTYTDPDGRFLLAPVPIGPSVLQIDGRNVDNVDYGFYEVRVVAKAGKTTPLGFTSYLTPIDHANEVAIASPTTQEAVIRTPKIPSLELHIAPGTVVRDAQGKVVTRISITPVPPDRQPFPYPNGTDQRIAFTIQPGAACLDTASGGIGYAWIVYPNYHHQLPRAREGLLRYEPDAHGWTVYGAGTVSQDGTQVVPDRNAVITDFGSAECDPSTRSHPPIFELPAPTRSLPR